MKRGDGIKFKIFKPDLAFDGRRVDGRRIIVDRELGRTKATWYPRRLGGGKGESRRDRRDEELTRELKK